MTLTLTQADATADPAERVAELERRLVEHQAVSEQRIIRAELKAEAIRAGMVDLDGLKLVDYAVVKMDPAGDVQGAPDAIRSLRRTKPWLFGAGNSSHPAGAPAADPPKPKSATEMGYAEWQAARAELLKRR
jgi:hypothetical protein